MSQKINLSELIASTHSQQAAQLHHICTLSDADREVVAQTGLKLLKHFLPLPGACLTMSSLYSVMLEETCSTKAYVVAGSLYVDETRVFGIDGDIDGPTRFSKSDLSWDGHAWVHVGNFIVDISIGRTARSRKCASILTKHIIEEYRPNNGLIMIRDDDASASGLIYKAQYVLSQNQVDALAKGAIEVATGKVDLSESHPRLTE